MKIYSIEIRNRSVEIGLLINLSDLTKSKMLDLSSSNIPISPAQNITTETVFTDLNKTNLLSNPIKTTPHMADPIKPSEITPTLTD
jgi:hypothetical protein